jgi:ABC-type antimicrobial peptide transport system permease subunit
MAYWVAQRTQEIGVRMALGARPFQVLRLVIWQGLSLSAGGLVIGVAMAIALSRVMSSLSFTNSAMGVGEKLVGAGLSDPVIYIGAAVFLSVLSMLAAFLPARRAASIDPMQALRME